MSEESPLLAPEISREITVSDLLVRIAEQEAKLAEQEAKIAELMLGYSNEQEARPQMPKMSPDVFKRKWGMACRLNGFVYVRKGTPEYKRVLHTFIKM